MPVKTIPNLALFTLISTGLQTTNLSAESINSWPNIQGLETHVLEQAFIQVFQDKPKHLDALTKGLQVCSLNPAKLAKLSNINEAAIFNEYEQAKVSISINELTLASSQKGCEALKTVSLEPIPLTKSTQFQVSADFQYDYFIFADYKVEGRVTSKIDGISHETELKTENTSELFYAFSQDPLIEGYQNTLYSLSTTNYDDFDIKTTVHSLQVTPNKPTNSAYRKLILSRNYQSGDSRNAFTTFRTNAKGQTLVQAFGPYSYSGAIDGQLSGLMVYDNYLYQSDKKQPPFIIACYQESKRLSVFQKTSSTSCKKASANQIGQPNIFVDAIYEQKLNSTHKARWNGIKHRLITQDKPSYVLNQSLETSEQPLAQSKAQSNKVNEKDFIAKQAKAKCALSNPNWAYLSDHCQNGLADGEGKAVDHQGLTFIGTFKAGERVSGDILQQGEMIFSGNFKQDKPDGSAICLFEGEYEECRFFRGKRIDALYKIRKENAKNLAQMTELQAQQNTNQTYQEQGNQSNIMVDALKEQGAKKAAAFIFDKLF